MASNSKTGSIDTGALLRGAGRIGGKEEEQKEGGPHQSYEHQHRFIQVYTMLYNTVYTLTTTSPTHVSKSKRGD